MSVLIADRKFSGLQRRLRVASLLALCAAAVGLPQAAMAQTTVAATTAASAASGASQTVGSFESALLAIMKAGKSSSFVQRFNMLAPVVDRTFDLQTILQRSVGLQWASMSPDQQQKLLATFRRYTIATWVANFDSWSGQQFRVSTGLRHIGSEVVVPTDLVPQNGSPTNLSYVMQQGASGWKVVDVLADGSISRVAVQRSDFSSILSSGGVPGLVARLQNKISSMSDGSLA